MSDVKNIEQYVAKNIIIELRNQNEELKKLRYLASKIEHCSVCYTPDSFSCNLTVYNCYTCDKIVCNQRKCMEGWLLEGIENDYNYEADYCSEKCYVADV